MKSSARVVAILSSTMWISINEFIRNTFVLHDAWLDHYRNMGQEFPEAPVNGAVWGVWSLVFAIVVHTLSTPFDLIKTAMLSWVIGFAMMWIVIGNLGVLPLSILPVAIPWSMAETFGAAYICSRLFKK